MDKQLTNGADNMTQEMNRFDIPATVKELIESAINYRLIDAFDVYAMAVEFGTDWKALASEITEYAFNSRHVIPEAHVAICPLNDKIHTEMAV